MAKKPLPVPAQDPPDDDDDEGVEFTAKQLEVISNTVNAAVTAHVKRHVKPLQDQLSVLPTIQETLEKLAAGAGAGAADPANAGKGAPAGAQPAPAKDDPEKIAMRKRLDAIEQEREQERTATRHAKRDTALTEIATKAGVDKNRVRGAVALLREQVKFDKDGNASMSIKRHGLDEDVTVEEGAAAFFNSDEGKAYLAPSSPAPRGGSGAGRGTTAAGVANRGASGQGNAPARGAGAAKEERKQKAAENFVGAVSELFSGGNIDVGG